MPTIEDLKYLQNQPLERKINITITRIIEWYQRYNGQVYVSFSGGKDSTVLLDLARRIYPDIEAVFIDTGLEYPEIREFVKSKENITWLKPKMQFKEVIEKYGYPVISKEQAFRIRKIRNQNLTEKYKEECLMKLGKHKTLLKAPFEISEQCCDVMKKRPVKKYEKATGKKMITGEMAEDSFNRKNQWLSNGCNAFDLNRPKSTPMGFWTEQDVLRYLKLTELPYATVYGDIVPKTKIEGQLIINDVPTDLITTRS